MESRWPETLSFKKQRAMEELVKGQGFAMELRLLLRAQNEDMINKKEDLVVKIIDSFTNGLSIILNNNGEVFDNYEVDLSHIKNNITTSEDSGESSKSSFQLKDQRGCYKRRKLGSKTLVKETCSWLDDGHIWRKYGMKSILGSKHPRNYFRCSYKHEQGCRATKQVQQITEDVNNYPSKFRTIYYGDHTCKKINIPISESHLDVMDDIDSSSFYLLSFDNKSSNVNNMEKKPYPTLSSSFSSSSKEEKYNLPVVNNPQNQVYNIRNDNKMLSKMLHPSSHSFDDFMGHDGLDFLEDLDCSFLEDLAFNFPNFIPQME
ncbi:hypothetical protein ACFE04_017260 [Oxalis oulophora]